MSAREVPRFQPCGLPVGIVFRLSPGSLWATIAKRIVVPPKRNTLGAKINQKFRGVHEASIPSSSPASSALLFAHRSVSTKTANSATVASQTFLRLSWISPTAQINTYFFAVLIEK
jgi:hypothetical protein